MTQGTVEERLVRLERLVDNVLVRLSRERTPQKDWRRTIGMFDDDPVMKQVVEGALRRREEERKQFYEDLVASAAAEPDAVVRGRSPRVRHDLRASVADAARRQSLPHSSRSPR